MPSARDRALSSSASSAKKVTVDKTIEVGLGAMASGDQGSAFGKETKRAIAAVAETPKTSDLGGSATRKAAQLTRRRARTGGKSKTDHRGSHTPLRLPRRHRRPCGRNGYKRRR